MKKYFSPQILLLISLCFCFNSYNAQAQKEITILETMQGKFYPKLLSQITWQPNSEFFSYIKQNSLYTNNFLQNEKLCISLDSLNILLQEDLWMFPSYTWLDTSRISFSIDSTFLSYDIYSNKIDTIFQVPSNAENVINIDFNNTFFTQNGLPIITHNDSLIKLPVPNKNFYYDKMIYRNEFGYTDGLFVSPSNKKVAFILKNDSIIPDYPFLSYDSIIPQITSYKYAFAGKDYEEIAIGIYNSETTLSSFIHLKEKKGYYTNPSWNTKEDKLYLFYLNRAQDSLACEEYDILSGEYIRTLFSETNEKYVEPQFPAYFYNNDSSFYYLSRKDGFMHIYSYNFETNNSIQITKGQWEVSDIIEMNDEGEIIFSGNSQNALIDEYIYYYSAEKKSYKILNVTRGSHSAFSNLEKDIVIDFYSDITQAGTYTITNIESETSKILYTCSNPFEGYSEPHSELSFIVNTNGDTLYTKTIYPPNFKKKKKYPVIIDVYGGPHLQNVRNSWLNGQEYLLYILASKGYIVYMLDNRGSANRGMDFESSTFRNLGYYESQDQKAGIDFLKKLPYIDSTRIGMYGWSFGGFMTLTMITEYNNDIKVGVAGSPVVDWNYYEAMYGERYMDTPTENTLHYSSTSIYNKVTKLKGKLLLVIGGSDETTVPSQSIKLLELANSKAVPIDFYMYPSQQHSMRGYHRYNLLLKIVDYFEKNL